MLWIDLVRIFVFLPNLVFLRNLRALTARFVLNIERGMEVRYSKHGTNESPRGRKTRTHNRAGNGGLQ